MNNKKLQKQFNLAARKYDSQRKILIPFFEDYYESGIKYLSSNKFDKILDLGVGTGLLSQYLFKYFPHSQYTLIDISGKMLDLAKKRFKNLSNIIYLEKDYSNNFPEGKFDLIASALSIHHLKDEEKCKLYRKIFNSLNKNGFFLNIDQYKSPSRNINKKYIELWINDITKHKVTKKDIESWIVRRKLDKETTMENEMNKLNEIGFKEVECLFKYWKLGVIAGKK